MWAQNFWKPFSKHIQTLEQLFINTFSWAQNMLRLNKLYLKNHKNMHRLLNYGLIEAEWCIYASTNLPSLVQIMASSLVGAKPLSEQTLEYC